MICGANWRKFINIRSTYLQKELPTCSEKYKKVSFYVESLLYKYYYISFNINSHILQSNHDVKFNKNVYNNFLSKIICMIFKRWHFLSHKKFTAKVSIVILTKFISANATNQTLPQVQNSNISFSKHTQRHMPHRNAEGYA